MSHQDHAELAPSASERWLTCPGSVPLSRGHYSDRESVFATEGTDHHEVAALCLENGWDAQPLVGKPMQSGALFTQDQVEHVQFYLDKVRAYVDTNRGSLKVEEEIAIEFLTGERNAKGKSDAVVFLPIPELIIIDLKYGMGVEVNPEENTQGMMYAAGVIEKHQLWDEIQQVRIVIIQPRIPGEKVKEWVCPIADLRQFCERVKITAKHIATLAGGKQYLGGKNKDVVRDVDATELHPSEKACKFCPAKALCPALAEEVRDAVSTNIEGFVDESGTNIHLPFFLGEAMDRTGLVEIWLHAVRAKVEAELLAGRPVQGKDGLYKLVRGRKGGRQWENEEEVKNFLDAYGLEKEEIYKFSLITAPEAEKRFKKAEPKLWEVLQPRITQKEGALSVADPTDKRPAVILEKPEAGFQVEDGSDLI